MTYKAREVLDDCRVALSMLEDEVDLQRWRIHWAAAVALIRAVGHVLDKVDGRDRYLKKATAAAFKRWKSDDDAHEIFREFIERERNNLLKEYSSDVHPLDSVSVAVLLTAIPEGGGKPAVMGADVSELDENVYRPMVDGPWVGDDARDVLSLAIDWWEMELNLIDKVVSKHRDSGVAGA
ncbi:hypothetical protein G6K98_15970 [Agrobacterium rhizogenes]|nr:hypothetical protein [Rhizobium rhizogenes]NTH59492.1 hypothetical protein [Rhizobium rhizogenes]NTH90643.1 hypothetical protein [Rhizobium rhizogenes]